MPPGGIRRSTAQSKAAPVPSTSAQSSVPLSITSAHEPAAGAVPPPPESALPVGRAGKAGGKRCTCSRAEWRLFLLDDAATRGWVPSERAGAVRARH
eukprot:scaffold789_cov125-Isochrysis_galbana.AAC.5